MTDDYRTSPRGSTPVPDPTELTDRAIAKLAVQLTQLIEGEIRTLNARLEGMEQATTLRLQTIDGIPNTIHEQVSHLELLHDVKFESIQVQFRERDIRAEREARDNKVAVDAAFAAQKEAAAKQDEANAKAIDKSEKATAETIKTNQELNATKTDAITKDVDSLKLAVNSILSSQVGRGEQRGESSENRGAIYATVGVIISIVLVCITIIGAIAALKP